LIPLCLCAVLAAATVAAGDTEVKPYGFVLVNAHYADGLTDSVDIPVKAINEEDSNFSIFPRQSRFGIKVTGPDVGTAKLLGQIELDLWGLRGSSAQGGVTQSAPRTRLAFLRLAWESTTLTIGQDWVEAFAPLNPTSLLHVSIPGCSSTGNLWNRLPQIRMDHNLKVGEKSRMTFNFALTRPFGADRDTTPVSQADLLGGGEYAGMPFVEGRAAFGGPAAGKSWAVGLAGHWGKEDFETSATPAGADLTTEGVALDFSVPLGKKAGIKGEYYSGKNLRMLFSNSYIIGDATDDAPVAEEGEAKGGWFEFSLAPTEKASINLGYGMEDLDDAQVTSGFKKNATVFGNLIWSFNKAFKMAFEVNQITTTTLGAADEEISVVVYDVAWQFVF
jgi:hypothetical protein